MQAFHSFSALPSAKLCLLLTAWLLTTCVLPKFEHKISPLTFQGNLCLLALVAVWDTFANVHEASGVRILISHKTLLINRGSMSSALTTAEDCPWSRKADACFTDRFRYISVRDIDFYRKTCLHMNCVLHCSGFLLMGWIYIASV